MSYTRTHVLRIRMYEYIVVSSWQILSVLSDDNLMQATERQEYILVIAVILVMYLWHTDAVMICAMDYCVHITKINILIIVVTHLCDQLHSADGNAEVTTKKRNTNTKREMVVFDAGQI